jgi:hypothetical protein
MIFRYGYLDVLPPLDHVCIEAACDERRRDDGQLRASPG